MKALFSLMVLLATTVSYANCENKVLDQYIKLTPQNEFHHMTEEAIKVKPHQKILVAYGQLIELNYKRPMEVYLAGSEYMGGHGIEALIVDPRNCEVLRMENVYRE
jgi:hypothetical protein